MEEVDWIREIHRFYLREKAVLSSNYSNAPHGRVEGQFGRQQSVKGYEHVIVYLQLSPNIDFEKVKQFLKFHLLEWVINKRDYKEALDIFFFNNEKNELIYNKRSWTRFAAPNISLLDFIDNTVKQVNSNYTRTLYQLYPKTGMYTQYNQGRHPNNNDLLIFITDRKGCDLADSLKELLKRRVRKMLWVKLEKEKDIIIEKRKYPILDNELMENNSEPYLDDVCDNKENDTLSEEDLNNFDFYLKYDTSDPWINWGGQKSIEISHTTVTINDGSRMSFPRNSGEKYSIPIDKIIELKNKLLRLNIFQIEEDYPSVSMDGTYWQLSVKFDGKSIRSKGHNNFPAGWSQIINAIEDCIKYKRKINIQKVKMIDKINIKVWEAINQTINKFRENPYYFFTESDIHSYFYHALYSSYNEESTEDIKRIYCVHREYPTNFRYRKQDLLNDTISEPNKLDGILGSRGHYDIAVLNPEFIKTINSERDIINKDIKLVIQREKSNKNFNIKELLFAIEFKYIINNSEKFVKEVKMDNKKLLFAINKGGAAKAINLVFCNVNSTKYIEPVITEVQNADKKILSIFIHSYYKEGKKCTPSPITNRIEPKIK